MNEHCAAFFYLKPLIVTYIICKAVHDVICLKKTHALGTSMSNGKNDTGGSANSTQSEPIKTEVELLQKLKELVSEYKDYEAPRIRSDGDIIISLNSDLKRNRQAFQSLADAVQLMMDRDKPKRYR